MNENDRFSSIEGWQLYTQQAEALVEAYEPGKIAALEAEYGFDQLTAVAHILESTDWGVETFP